MPTPESRALETADAVAPHVLRRFHYPLPARPGEVALYTELQDTDGQTRFRWDGTRLKDRIPPEYAAPLAASTDTAPRRCAVTI